MRPTGGFNHAAINIELVITTVRIRLQHTGESFQVRLRVQTLSVRGISKPDCGRSQGAGVSVIPYVHPEPSGFGFTVARCQNRHRCIVAESSSTPR
jgi:hypothetical protein